MSLLEKITYYSQCDFISNLKKDDSWKHGVREVIRKKGIERFSINEWEEALRYLVDDNISCHCYDDIIHELTMLDRKITY